MTSAVTICSNALTQLGSKPINSFDDPTEFARLCSANYPQLRDRVIRYPWDSCKKRVILSPDADKPAFGWGFQFSMPADCTKVISVGQYGQEDEYRIEGRKILMSANTCRLRYVFKNTNEETWDDELVYAMTVGMKAILAYAVTQTSQLRDSLTNEFEALLKLARASNAQDEPGDTLGDFPLISCRG